MNKTSEPSGALFPMSNTFLPKHVISFIREYVDGLSTLELLMAVHRGPCNATSISLAAAMLDLSRTRVRELALSLAARGLVSLSSDDVRLASGIDDRLALADLAGLYLRDRALVLDVLRVLGRRDDGSADNHESVTSR